jgi:hypothetical protein
MNAGPKAPGWLVVLIVVVLVGIAGYFGYTYWFAPLPVQPPPPN